MKLFDFLELVYLFNEERGRQAHARPVALGLAHGPNLELLKRWQSHRRQAADLSLARHVPFPSSGEAVILLQQCDSLRRNPHQQGARLCQKRRLHKANRQAVSRLEWWAF
ncbi:hypothetical protein D3C78_1320470 [compost metagenome]